MPFYQTDDITCFVFTAITEDIEDRLENDKKDTELFDRLTDILAYNNMNELKGLCESHIEKDLNSGQNSIFFDTVLNSIDLKRLHSYLVEWAEDMKIDTICKQDKKFDGLTC